MAFPVNQIRAAGRSPSRFLRGDGQWASPITGAADALRQTGGYYTSFVSGTPATAGHTRDIIQAVPFLVSKTENYDRLAFYKGNNGTATAAAWAAVYANKSASEFYPGALIVQGTVHLLDSTEFNGAGFFADTISLALQPGLYWLAFVSGVAASSSIFQTGAVAGATPQVLPIDVTGAPAAAIGFRGAFTYQASAPDPFPASIARNVSTTAALPLLRFAS